MMRTPKTGLIIAFVLIVALLVCNAWISNHNIVSLRDQAHSVQHVHEVVQAIYDVRSALKDAETGQRGYLLTEDDRYLEPYWDGTARVDGAFARLSELIADDPAELENMKALQSSAAGKLRELKSTLDLLTSDGLAAARKYVKTGVGLFEMNEIRSISSRMIDAENAILAQRSDAAARTFRTALLSSLVTTAASILLFALAVLLIRRNISARMRATMALSEQRDLLRTTLSSVVEGILVTDANGALTFMNPIAERFTGYRLADVDGRPLSSVLDIRDEATRAPLLSRAVEVLYGGKPSDEDGHRILIAEDQSELSIEESAAALVDQSGARLGVVLTLRDVTTQRRNEKEIAEARSFAERIVDTIPDPLVILDAHLTVRSANLAYFAMFRTSAFKAVGHSLFEAGPSHWNEAAMRLLLDIGPDDDDVRSAELEHVLAEDDTRIFRLNARRVHGPGTELRLVMLAIRDVTEPRTNERRIKQLLAAEQANAGRLRSIAAASLTLNSAHSPDSVLDVLRGEAKRIFAVDEAVVTLQSAGLRSPSSSTRPTDSPVPASRSFDGSFLSVPLTGRGGRTIGLVNLQSPSTPERSATESDESILRQLAQVASVAIENAHLYEELREGDRRKDEFLATLAHELRNPLAPVRNSVQILLSPRAGSSDRDQAVAAIDRQITLLVRLVDDLLDVSRITRGKVVLKREDVELSAIIAQALEISRPIIHASGNTLSVQLPQEKVTLHADPSRLAQVLANLLNNAAKYTESGGSIRLACELEGPELLIKVRDTGIGIPAEMLPHIFDMFWQVDHAFERAQGGLGIGLTLVRQLVDLHGGSVAVHSEGTGRGSEFTVRLPASTEGVAALAVPPKPSSASQPGTGDSERILVVDDNQDSAESLALFLRLQGHVTRTAHDGVAALDVEREFEPRIILLDIGLPRLNGYETAREIRARRGQTVTIVAMTGWSQAEHRRRTLEAGFDRHLVKPVDPVLLRELLATLRSRAS